MLGVDQAKWTGEQLLICIDAPYFLNTTMKAFGGKKMEFLLLRILTWDIPG